MAIYEGELQGVSTSPTFASSSQLHKQYYDEHELVRQRPGTSNKRGVNGLHGFALRRRHAGWRPLW